MTEQQKRDAALCAEMEERGEDKECDGCSCFGCIAHATLFDAAAVVRCKDCAFSSKQGAYAYVGQSDTHVNCKRLMTANHSILIMSDDGYCSMAKMREGE